MPANFCGVCALKPTWGVLPMRGHVPPPPGIDAEVDLGVGGPMARNVDDLKLLWSVLSKTPEAPRRGRARARASRSGTKTRSCRSAAMRRMPSRAPPMRWQGRVRRSSASQAPVDTRELLVNYMWLLMSIVGAGFPESVLNEMAKTREADLKAFAASRDPWSRELNRLAIDCAAGRSAGGATRAPGAEGSHDGVLRTATMRS